jgi:hypothetical protein
MNLYPLHAASPEHPRIRGHELPYQRREHDDPANDAAKRLGAPYTREDWWSVGVDMGASDSAAVVVVRR